jgi:predicted transcriptional regulator
VSDSPLNPVDIEAKIDEVKNRIANSVKVVSEREAEAKAKRTDFDAAFAHAYLAAQDYPAHERKYRALLATVDQRRAAEVAESAYRYAERKAHALDKELFAWQTISKSVVAMYGAVRA